MAAVNLQGVRKVYPNGHVAVAGADIGVGDGELVVLVGPSGCGKTTLLRMIAGLETASAGTLRIGGRVVNDVAPKDRDIAMVFQNYALYPHMTVAQNLAFGLQLHGLPRAEVDRRVREAAATLELSQRLDARPAALSGGQRQRVALGRALVREPKVFLLDEPLSNLDARLRLSMRLEIARLHRRLGATMIYVTHDQVEAMTLGQRIVVLDGGVVQQIDTPMALYDRPANLFVAGFLGSPAMNRLRGTLREADGRWALHVERAAQALPLGAASPALAAWRDRDVVLGLRPEHLQRADAAGAMLNARLDLIEPVGSETYLNLHAGAQALVMRTAARHWPAPGDELPLRFELAHAHFFDADSGVRIG